MAPSALPPLDKIDPARAWQPWTPDARNPWGLKWAGHLYRRAGFGASLPELHAAVKRGLPATLDLLLKGEPGADDILPTLNKVGAEVGSEDANGLRGWWLYVMLQGRHPLREKMTLFWHNHFATSIAKVNFTALMFRQNALIRRHALGKFGPFVQEMSKDTAMLVWLDANRSVKGRPNENYARELMELFTLGVGNYTETDVREAARAFTGWHSEYEDYEFNSHFQFKPRYHDDGVKTVLGQKGNWNGDDIVRICLKQPVAARFLVRKLYTYLVSEGQTPPDSLLQPLADAFRKSDYDIAALVRTILASRHFYSAHAFRQRIKSPVEYVLGAVIAVADGRSVPQGVLLKRLEQMGQLLFAPPNVKGWPGGQAWLNTSTLLARQNFALDLAMGTLWRGGSPVRGRPVFTKPPTPGSKPKAAPDVPEEPAPATKFDPARLLHAEKVSKPEDVVRVLLDDYLPGGVTPSARAKLVSFVAKGNPSGAALDRRAREAVHAILTMPETQLA